MHVVSTARPDQAAAPAASQPVPGGQPEQPARQPGPGIAAALQSLARQVSELQADNDRLREDNDRLSAEVARIRALMRQIGGAIAQQASAIAQQASQLDAGWTSAAATLIVHKPGSPAARIVVASCPQRADQVVLARPNGAVASVQDVDPAPGSRPVARGGWPGPDRGGFRSGQPR